MTEAATEQGTLIKNALYTHYGVVYIAISTTHLAELTGDEDSAVTPNDFTTLFATPGTIEWADRMVRFRRYEAGVIKNMKRDHNEAVQHLERLGEAILQEAVNRDWCEEYDDFAEEWGLPTRAQEYDVTITVRIKANSQDSAIEIAQGGISLDSYSTDGVIDSPEYEASVVS